MYVIRVIWRLMQWGTRTPSRIPPPARPFNILYIRVLEIFLTLIYIFFRIRFKDAPAVRRRRWIPRFDTATHYAVDAIAILVFISVCYYYYCNALGLLLFFLSPFSNRWRT